MGSFFKVTNSPTERKVYFERIPVGVQSSGADDVYIEDETILGEPSTGYLMRLVGLEGKDKSMYVLDYKDDEGDVYISTQPDSQVAYVGDALQLSVVAMAGTKPYSYQWSFNQKQIVGGVNSSAVTDTLKVPGITLASAGEYTCLVTDAKGYCVETTGANIHIEPAAK